MNQYYFTFGQSHSHTLQNGKLFDKDCVLLLKADDSQEARGKMFEFFGAKWSHMYEEKPDMELFPRGVIELTDNDEPPVPHVEEAQWDIQCFVNCPHCEFFVDLMYEKDSGLDFESMPRPGRDTSNLDLHVTCGSCKKEFIVDNIIY